jgi:hypothetical protein
MPKKVFFSFHYKLDNWRVGQIRNIGAIEGSPAATDNDWETVKKGGDAAIQKWIDGQIAGRSCGIVLIGAETAGRPWIEYEIKKLWNDGKGVVGIYIHNLKDKDQNHTRKGANPFEAFSIRNGTIKLSSIVKAYDPPYTTSTYVYDYIKQNLESWIDEAIKIRANY